jgi:hypothetical protein
VPEELKAIRPASEVQERWWVVNERGGKKKHNKPRKGGDRRETQSKCEISRCLLHLSFLVKGSFFIKLRRKKQKNKNKKRALEGKGGRGEYATTDREGEAERERRKESVKNEED